MFSLTVVILLLSLIIILVTVAIVKLRTSECPKCPDTDLPVFNCSNCTIPEPNCDKCPVNLSKCRSTFPPDCTQCPTDCIKANSDPKCAPNCSKCNINCPVDLHKCRDALDNLYYDKNVSELNTYSRLNILINNLVEGRFGFSITFKPISRNGIICAFIEKVLVVVYILESKVRLYIKSSDTEIYDDFPVPTLLTLNQISTVALTTSPNSNDVIVTVNASQKTIKAPTPVTFSSKMFVGGVPTENFNDIPSNARTSFKGCIYEIKSESKIPLDLMKLKRTNVDLGCQ